MLTMPRVDGDAKRQGGADVGTIHHPRMTGRLDGAVAGTRMTHLADVVVTATMPHVVTVTATMIVTPGVGVGVMKTRLRMTMICRSIRAVMTITIRTVTPRILPLTTTEMRRVAVADAGVMLMIRTTLRVGVVDVIGMLIRMLIVPERLVAAVADVADGTGMRAERRMIGMNAQTGRPEGPHRANRVDGQVTRVRADADC
jgi:hypothetical protein